MYIRYKCLRRITDMYTYDEFPDHVTKQEDGTYRWKCAVGKDYERKSYRITIIVCGVIAAFILIYGGILSFMYHQSPLITAACAFIIIMIALLICFGLDRLPGNMTEIYRLHEDYIVTGSGKTRGVFEFSRTKEMIVSADYIELIGRFGGPRIYVPEEDMPFVKGYISCRIPGNAEIREA